MSDGTDGRAAPTALIYYGHPLVAMGKTEPRPTDHLDAIRVPQLFMLGGRDRPGPIDSGNPRCGCGGDGQLVGESVVALGQIRGGM
jgi:hypothetical protein